MSDSMPENAGPVPIAPPSTAVLRRLLMRVLNSDTDLDGFCFDHFQEEVHARFTNGMERVQKLTVLLRRVDAQHVFARLQEGYAKQVARILPELLVEVAREQRRRRPWQWALFILLVVLGSSSIYLTWRAIRPMAPNLVLAGYLCSPDGTPFRRGLVDLLDSTGSSQAIAPGVLDDDGFFVVELLAKAAPAIKLRAQPNGCRTIEMSVQSGTVTRSTCGGLPHHQPDAIPVRRWTVSCVR